MAEAGLRRCRTSAFTLVVVSVLLGLCDAFVLRPSLFRAEHLHPRTGISTRQCIRVGENAVRGDGRRCDSCSTTPMVEMLRMASARSVHRKRVTGGTGPATQLRAGGLVLEADLVAARPVRASKSAPNGHSVTMGGVAFKVADLLLLVDDHGGAVAVTKNKLWKSIASKLGVDTKVVTNASTRLRILHDATVNRLRDAASDHPTQYQGASELSAAKGHVRADMRHRRVHTLEERSKEPSARASKESVGRGASRRRKSPRARKGRQVSSRAKGRAPNDASALIGRPAETEMMVRVEGVRAQREQEAAQEMLAQQRLRAVSAAALEQKQMLEKQLADIAAKWAASASEDLLVARQAHVKHAEEEVEVGRYEEVAKGTEKMKYAQAAKEKADSARVHPFFSSAVEDKSGPGESKKAGGGGGVGVGGGGGGEGRTRKAKAGTRKGLQKGLQSVSAAVALPDEEQDDVKAIAQKELLEYMAEVGVEEKNLDKVLEAYPQLQHLSVIQNLRPKIRFLTREIGIAPHCVRKVIVSFPQILGLSIDDNLRPTARYLLDDVGIPQDRLNKTIVTRPQILACSVERNLRPKLELLVEMAGVKREQLALVVARAPHVLGYSPSNIARFLIFLLHEVGVERARVAKLIANSPQLLGLSVENNIRPKIRFLVDEVGVSESSLGQVIGSFPNILGYSVEDNMRPKLKYLAEHILQVPMHKLGRPLEKCPQLLGYSLEKRIKPRHLLLKKRGLRLGLSRMLAPTDVEFRRILRIHDAQAEEEERAAKAAAAAIRSVSWAAEMRAVGEEETENEEEAEVRLAAAAAGCAAPKYYWH